MPNFWLTIDILKLFQLLPPSIQGSTQELDNIVQEKIECF
jgi:hypothetical protein